MTDKLPSIPEFAKLRPECVFCQIPMNVTLTNFIGLTRSGLPLIRAPLTDGKINCVIDHTTATFSVKADVSIDIDKNVLQFSDYTNGEMPSIDEYLVRQTFEDFQPYIELHCSSKKCGLKYHICSGSIRLTKLPETNGAWTINPLRFLSENVILKKYVITNHSHAKVSRIYSRSNPDAGAIETPLIDFSTMDKERLINRIQTIVTFS